MNQGSGQWERLCELVSGLGDKDGVPGASLGVLHGNETYTAGFGVTNVDHPLGVTNETYFQTGSISKTFVATAPSRIPRG
jgi:CubicO group peptidase (beta-lactamase class C family)